METIVEYLPYIVVAGFAYWIGWHVRAIVILSNLSKNPEHFIKLLEQVKSINNDEELGVPIDAIEVEAEHVNGMVYAYDKKTGQFLGQAKSLHEAMVEAARRFPTKSFWHPELKEDSQSVC